MKGSVIVSPNKNTYSDLIVENSQNEDIDYTLLNKLAKRFSPKRSDKSFKKIFKRKSLKIRKIRKSRSKKKNRKSRTKNK